MQISCCCLSIKADDTKKDIKYRIGYGNHLDMLHCCVDSLGNLYS